MIIAAIQAKTEEGLKQGTSNEEERSAFETLKIWNEPDECKEAQKGGWGISDNSHDSSSVYC